MSKIKDRTMVIVREDTYQNNQRTFVVLGAPRGGTSMISGLLNRLGIHMGENLGHQYEDPNLRNEVPLEKKIETILNNNSKHERWGWKLPDTIYYYDQIHEYLINPVFILIYRNPLGVSLSSSHREGWNFRFDLLDVPIDHYKNMHAIIRKYPEIPCYAFSFDEAIRKKNQRKFVLDVAKITKIDISENQIHEALSFIEPDKGYKDPDKTQSV